MVKRLLLVDKENTMGECGACEGMVININIEIKEVHITHEDQCTFVEHVYMDDDEGMDMDINLDLDSEE